MARLILTVAIILLILYLVRKSFPKKIDKNKLSFEHMAYKVLNVSEKSTNIQIFRAWQLQAKISKDNKNQEKLDNINWAYEHLKLLRGIDEKTST